MIYFLRKLVTLVLVVYSISITAGEADIVDVTYKCESACSFSATVVHADDGWDHYADRWEVLTLSGEIIATRVLAHPHQRNQPFTRSLSNVVLPKNTSTVIVRAHDSVHGYGGKEIKVEIKLPR